MKIIYLHQYFNTPNMSGGTRSYEMARRMVRAGHEVHMITSSRDSSSDQHCWQTTNEAGIQVHCYPVPYSFADGSFGTILYLANGGKAFPKERIEVFANGAVLQLDNFKALRSYGWPGFKGKKLMSQDKGQQACATLFIQAIQQGKPSPIPADEVFEVSRVSVQVAQSLRG